MNKQRRQELNDIISELDDLKDRLNSVMEEEQEAYDNMPESLQDSERGEEMQFNVDMLDSIVTDIECVIENINEIC